MKELQLKGNPLKDRRFKKLVENDRTLPKQVLDYIKQHCARSSNTGSSKNKKGKKGHGMKDQDQDEVKYSFIIKIYL